MKRTSLEKFERALADLSQKKYVLVLYVAGSTSRSLKAISNVKQICEEHLKNRYDLQIVDVYQTPALAKGEQILAVPTLLKKLPLPLRKFVGDLSEKEKILFGLDVREKNE